MCNCAFKTGNRPILLNQGFVNIIPASTFVSDATFSDFLFYRCINESKFLAALDTVKDGDTTIGKYVKTDEDVRKLAVHADNGTDITKWGVSFKALLGNIKFDQKELDNAQCKTAFSIND